MPNLLTSELSPGMVLADDVTDRQGRPLLTKQTELTAKHIKIFKTWGVDRVNVEGDDSEPALQDVIDAHPEFAVEAKQAADILFQHTDPAHPFYQALRPLCIQHFVRLKAEQL